MTDFKNSIDISSLLRSALNKGAVDNLGIDLRNISEGSRDEKIKRIAVQFEEMLINTMLKNAFGDENKKAEGNLFKTGVYNDFRTMFMSQFIADNGGLGYQEIIEEQIRKKYQASGERFDFKPDLTKIPLNLNLFTKPVNGAISSSYGIRKDPIDGKIRFHSGLDFAVPLNTPVKSFMKGKVTYSGFKQGYGLLVELTHKNGYVTRYGHNSKLLVKEGQEIKGGEVISLSGSSGRSTGPHLHFEVNKDNKPVNPEKLLF